jgi:hypothetical protein
MSGYLKENQRRSDHECKGYFHWEILSYTSVILAEF